MQEWDLGCPRTDQGHWRKQIDENKSSFCLCICHQDSRRCSRKNQGSIVVQKLHKVFDIFFKLLITLANFLSPYHIRCQWNGISSFRTIVNNPETDKHEKEEKNDYSEHFKYYAALIDKTSSTTENPVSAKKELKELKKLVSSVDPGSIAENVTLITHKEGDIEHPLKPEEEHTVTETVDASNSSINILKMMFKS